MSRSKQWQDRVESYDDVTNTAISRKEEAVNLRQNLVRRLSSRMEARTPQTFWSQCSKN